MSKAVLISIRPKWCELIANGTKTVEVRKTRPKLETPFKCYIYCTKDKNNHFWTGKRYSYADDHSHNAFDKIGSGKIIGEFICDRIDEYDDDTIFSFSHEDYARWNDFGLDRACMHPEDFQNYADGKWLYGWHIVDLKIYDAPRELSTLCRPYECDDCDAKWATDCNACHDKGKIKRPPQSWCYVEVT